MPKKRRPRRKPVPAILRTPISITLDLVPKVFGDSTPQAEAEARRLWEERGKRLRAIFEYYDINPRSDPNALTKLIWFMAADLFPVGTLNRKLELLAFMRAHQDAGHTLERAAEEYAKIHRHLSPQGIVARFHEFQIWERTGNLTAKEMLELLAREE